MLDEHLVYLRVREAEAFFDAPAEDLLPRLFERASVHRVFGVPDDLFSAAVTTEPVFDGFGLEPGIGLRDLSYVSHVSRTIGQNRPRRHRLAV